MSKKQYSFEYDSYSNITELSGEDQNLIRMAIKAAKKAYAPYSSFHVGTAVLLDDNTIVTGNNQENAAYPSGLCAERVALFYANANYPNKSVKAIAIVALKNGELLESITPPCGSCRQVMIETETRFKQKIKVIMGSKNNFWIINNTKQLLPLSFTSDLL